jgi:hypothetical protein
MSPAANITPVIWVKNTANGQYFDLLRLDLTAPYFANGKKGVYIIWYTSPQGGKVIYIGQGNIGERLRAHRSDPRITQYATYGNLKVTWTLFVDALTISRVEAYLHGLYNPIIPERKPDAVPLAVSLPAI